MWINCDVFQSTFQLKHNRCFSRILLRAGVDINKQTSRGTCLHEATMFGKADVVRYLLTVICSLGVMLNNHHYDGFIGGFPCLIVVTPSLILNSFPLR